jgi:hypothetical protein
MLSEKFLHRLTFSQIQITAAFGGFSFSGIACPTVRQWRRRAQVWKNGAAVSPDRFIRSDRGRPDRRCAHREKHQFHHPDVGRRRAPAPFCANRRADTERTSNPFRRRDGASDPRRPQRSDAAMVKGIALNWLNSVNFTPEYVHFRRTISALTDSKATLASSRESLVVLRSKAKSFGSIPNHSATKIGSVRETIHKTNVIKNFYRDSL